MRNEVQVQLSSIRTRQRLSRSFSWGAMALLAGASLGCILLILQRAEIMAEGPGAWIMVASAALLGLAVGFLWPNSWNGTASLVDSTYDLKDRALTAMDFADRSGADDLQRMQVEEAMEHLSKVNPVEVLPFRLPKLMIPAVCALALMFGIVFAPIQNDEVLAEAPEAMPVVLEQAKLLEETMLPELEELADEFEDQELKELVQEMEETLEDLQEPEVDQREALAKLSEMQQSIAEAMEQLDLEQVDAQLEQLAKALESSEATEAASQALKSLEYDKAATELEKIDASTMTRKEKEAVKSDLAKLNKELGEGQQGELSEAISEMLEGMEQENQSKCKGGQCKAAGVCKKQGVKKKIGQCLGCQLNRLSECKGACQGQCQSNNWAKSNSPSNKAGKAATGQPTGEDKTKLDSNRTQENINGIAGEGPSERETLSTPEARQDASRSYEKKYAEFKKQMESDLDSEPLPLGHRQTVRSYFESIRPSNGDVTE